MIRIFGISSGGLSEDTLRQGIDPILLLNWENHHTGMKNEASRTSSLAAVYLLSQSGHRGVLLYSEEGKPIFATENGEALAISITHTRAHTFLAISDTYDDIGIDAEETGRLSHDSCLKMASRWFSLSEQAVFQRSADEETFLRIWTRKEALVKRSGEGLKALRATDTTAVDNTSFFEYRIGNTLISLACDEGEEATEPIMLKA